MQNKLLLVRFRSGFLRIVCIKFCLVFKNFYNDLSEVSEFLLDFTLFPIEALGAFLLSDTEFEHDSRNMLYKL